MTESEERQGWNPGDPVNLEYGGITVRSLANADIDERFVNLLHDEAVIRHVDFPRKFNKEQFLQYVKSHDNRKRFLLSKPLTMTK